MKFVLLQVMVVELTRGWNSRLGFTLCADNEGRTLVKDIYPDSVAYKDGRIKKGDHLVMVKFWNKKV
jgi:C-terminal processing protease CtpA/Prc